jgi:hypothetical protein
MFKYYTGCSGLASGSHLAQAQWQPRILQDEERCGVTLDVRLRIGYTLYVISGLSETDTKKLKK